MTGPAEPALEEELDCAEAERNHRRRSSARLRRPVEAQRTGSPPGVRSATAARCGRRPGAAPRRRAPPRWAGRAAGRRRPRRRAVFFTRERAQRGQRGQRDGLLVQRVAPRPPSRAAWSARRCGPGGPPAPRDRCRRGRRAPRGEAGLRLGRPTAITRRPGVSPPSQRRLRSTSSRRPPRPRSAAPAPLRHCLEEPLHMLQLLVPSDELDLHGGGGRACSGRRCAIRGPRGRRGTRRCAAPITAGPARYAAGLSLQTSVMAKKMLCDARSR